MIDGDTEEDVFQKRLDGVAILCSPLIDPFYTHSSLFHKIILPPIRSGSMCKNVVRISQICKVWSFIKNVLTRCFLSDVVWLTIQTIKLFDVSQSVDINQ